jgi:ABC-type amino acid transport substrate-binding protein
MLRSTRSLIFAGLLAAATAAPQAQGGKQELRVVTRIAPPIVRMEQGELGGFAIEIWNDIALRMHVKTRYQVAPDVGALLERVRWDKADVGVGAISITSTREREFDFSRPILKAGLQIMVRSQDTYGISGPEDLRGKRVATAPGSTAAAFLRELNARVYQFPVLKFAYFALLDRKVDAVVFDAPVLLNYAAFAGKGRVRMVGPIYRQEDYAIVFPQKSPLRDQVDDALDAAREDGSYQKLYEKWFTD